MSHDHTLHSPISFGHTSPLAASNSFLFHTHRWISIFQYIYDQSGLEPLHGDHESTMLPLHHWWRRWDLNPHRETHRFTVCCLTIRLHLGMMGLEPTLSTLTRWGPTIRQHPHLILDIFHTSQIQNRRFVTLKKQLSNYICGYIPN
jgi:hypothetical protein